MGKRQRALQDVLAPTPERFLRGRVERLEKPIKDSNDAICWPYRSIDILVAMERRGTITQAMRAAGETFRAKFCDAHHEELRAANLMRSSCSKSTAEPHSKTYAARKVVWRAIVAVGGLRSAGGSCLWHVVGLEWSLKHWALQQGWYCRPVREETASGILIGALGTLEAHFAGTL